MKNKIKHFVKNIFKKPDDLPLLSTSCALPPKNNNKIAKSSINQGVKALIIFTVIFLAWA